MITSRRTRAAKVLAMPGLGSMLRRLGTWRGVVILGYHRIGDPAMSQFDPGVWSAAPETFETQLRWLRQETDVITPADLADVSQRRHGRFSVITFDDGYRDNFEVAFPILQSLDLPATFFLSTGYLDQPRAAWWDELAWMLLHADVERLELPEWFEVPLSCADKDCSTSLNTLLQRYKNLPEEQATQLVADFARACGSGRCPAEIAADQWMTWDMIREMHAAGMTFGGHTVHHPILSRCSETRQIWEITECGRRLQAELGVPMRYFSYPRGKPDAFTQFTQSVLREQGIEWAFCYNGGLLRFGSWKQWELPRVAIEFEQRESEFQALFTLPQVFA